MVRPRIEHAPLVDDADFDDDGAQEPVGPERVRPAFSAPAVWGGDVAVVMEAEDSVDEFAFLDDLQVEPVAPERLRPYFSRRPAVVHVPERRDNIARPRERRARRSTTSSASRASPDDSELPEPEPVGRISGFTAASERLSRHLQRRSAAMRLA